MKTTRWKLFVDYEREEKWLNEKAAEGLAMIHYSPGRYTFEECPPEEYIYRIELLKNRVNHPDSIKYIQFMEDSGTEPISTYMKWVYYRKKTVDGPFEIYSNLESRITHYQRLVRLWIFVGALILLALLSETVSIVSFFKDGSQSTALHAAYYAMMGAILILDMILFLKFLPGYIKKIKRLKRERDVRE